MNTEPAQSATGDGSTSDDTSAPPTLEPIPAPSEQVLAKCPWRNPAQWEVWSDREILGQPYSFSHLLPFDMTLSRPAKGKHQAMSIDIRVVFDCHVVTESFDSQKHTNPLPEESWRDAGNVLRVFHSNRYQLSAGLPKLLQDMAAEGKNPRCFETNRNNFMVLEKQGAAQSIEYYHVFFDLYRSPRPQGGSRLVMYVQSAYLKDVPMRNRRTDSTLFAAVCVKKFGQ